MLQRTIRTLVIIARSFDAEDLIVGPGPELSSSKSLSATFPSSKHIHVNGDFFCIRFPARFVTISTWAEATNDKEEQEAGATPNGAEPIMTKKSSTAGKGESECVLAANMST